MKHLATWSTKMSSRNHWTFSTPPKSPQSFNFPTKLRQECQCLHIMINIIVNGSKFDPHLHKWHHIFIQIGINGFRSWEKFKGSWKADLTIATDIKQAWHGPISSSRIHFRGHGIIVFHLCWGRMFGQSSLHENAIFSVCARMGNAAYIIFIMWNSISGLDSCYHFRLNISCGVAVTVRSHQKKYQVTF